MGKVKDRKSDSWKPGMVSNGGGMISKNQKRKEKRLSQNLNVVKMNAEGTPSKKPALGLLNKIGDNLNSSLNLPGQGKKKENKLSLSLPIKGDKKPAKMNLSPLKKNTKPAGFINNLNSPNKKSKKLTLNMSKLDSEKLIDSEAEEGEEPVTDKVIKPYEKGSQKRKLKRKMSMMNKNEDDSSEEDSDDDDEAFDSAEKFVDVEASEGEETDESFDDELEDESDDDEMDDFFNDDEENDLDDSENESDAESEDESEVDSDNESAKPSVTPFRRESVVLPLSKKAKKDLVNTPQSNKTEEIEAVKDVPKLQNVSEKKKLASTPQVEKTKKKNEPVEEKALQKETTSQKKAKKKDKTAKSASAEEKKISEFVGFIRNLSHDITDDAVKSALVTKIKLEDILSLVSKSERKNKNRRKILVYLKNEESLDALLNHKFYVNDKFSFGVYKARESAKRKERFVAFLPRVPLSITSEALKEALEKEVGANAVLKIRFKKMYKHMKTHNILVDFADVGSLQKIVQKGECKVGDCVVIIRTAFEAGVKIPAYKVLFTLVPPKTSEALLKKCIEAQVGKNTVLSIRFAIKKPSFAFVSFANEDAQKKALEVGKNVTVNGTKLAAEEFKTNPPKKRAPLSQEAKQKKKETKKRKRGGGGAAAAAAAVANNSSPKPPFKKKFKRDNKVDVANPVKKEPQSPSVVATDANAKSKSKNKKNKNAPNSSPTSPAAQPRKNQRNFSKSAKFAGRKRESPSSAQVTAKGDGAAGPKFKQKNKLAQQEGPKFAKKKQFLAAKLEAKKKNKKGPKKE